MKRDEFFRRKKESNLKRKRDLEQAITEYQILLFDDDARKEINDDKEIKRLESKLQKSKTLLKTTLEKIEKLQDSNNKRIAQRRTMNRKVKECTLLLKRLGIKVFSEDKVEGECICAVLQKKGLVDYVCTIDSDVFVYGANKVIRELQYEENGIAKPHNNCGYLQDTSICRIYVLPKDNNQQNLQETLVKAALFLGCDYFDGIKGYGKEKFIKDVFKNPNISVQNILSKYPKIVANNDMTIEEIVEKFEELKQEFILTDDSVGQDKDWVRNLNKWHEIGSKENILTLQNNIFMASKFVDNLSSLIEYINDLFEIEMKHCFHKLLSTFIHVCLLSENQEIRHGFIEQVVKKLTVLTASNRNGKRVYKTNWNFGEKFEKDFPLQDFTVVISEEILKTSFPAEIAAKKIGKKKGRGKKSETEAAVPKSPSQSSLDRFIVKNPSPSKTKKKEMEIVNLEADTPENLSNVISQMERAKKISKSQLNETCSLDSNSDFGDEVLTSPKMRRKNDDSNRSQSATKNPPIVPQESKPKPPKNPEESKQISKLSNQLSFETQKNPEKTVKPVKTSKPKTPVDQKKLLGKYLEDTTTISESDGNLFSDDDDTIPFSSNQLKKIEKSLKKTQSQVSLASVDTDEDLENIKILEQSINTINEVSFLGEKVSRSENQQQDEGPKNEMEDLERELDRSLSISPQGWGCLKVEISL